MCKFGKNTIKNTVKTYKNDTGSRYHIGYNLLAHYQTLFEMIKVNISCDTIAFNSKKSEKGTKLMQILKKK